ncbi:MAG: 50S ribosomal protein L31e [Nanoarchaeota archaeon]
MAEENKILEREYVIPLRRACLKAARYDRMRIAIRTIKRFIAKHMKITNRNLDNVRLDVYLNNELWFRGRKNPPAKVKVRARKENDVVKVDFVDIPEHVRFLKTKIERRHKIAEKKTKVETPKEEKKENTTEEKNEEKEKEQAVAEQRTKEAEQSAKVQKHLTVKKTPQIHRMSLKK